MAASQQHQNNQNQIFHFPSILVKALSTRISIFLTSVYIHASNGKKSKIITKSTMIKRIPNASDL